MEENLNLTTDVTHLNDEVKRIKENEETMKNEHEEAKKILAKMTSGTEKLDKMLGYRNKPNDKRGFVLGFMP